MSKNNSESYLCGVYDKSNNSVYFSYYDILKSLGINEPFKVMKKIKTILGLKVLKKKLMCNDNKFRYTSVIELDEVIRVIFYLNTNRAICLRKSLIKVLRSKLINIYSKNIFVNNYEKR